MMRNMAGMMKKVEEMKNAWRRCKAKWSRPALPHQWAAMSSPWSHRQGFCPIRVDQSEAVDPAEIDVLEDMICLATNNAKQKAETEMAARIKTSPAACHCLPA